MQNHSSHIAAALVIAWVIFVVSRGELPIYLGILGIGNHDISQCGAGGGIFSSVGGTVGAAVDTLNSGARNSPDMPGTVAV